MLGISISYETDTAEGVARISLEDDRRSVFEVEGVERDSGKRPTGRWWDTHGFLSCWRSEE